MLECGIKLGAVFIHILILLADDAYEYDYGYEDNPDDIKELDGGERLVGARAGDSNSLSFVVSFNFVVS